MADNRTDLTRRKLLTAAGAVPLALAAMDLFQLVRTW